MYHQTDTSRARPSAAVGDRASMRRGCARRPPTRCGSPARPAGPRSADPNQTTQGADNWAVIQMFEYLAQPPDGNFGVTPEDFEPWLAESWTTSDDARPGSSRCARASSSTRATAR